MRNHGQLFWCRRLIAWQITFCLAVFAFLLRASIPFGYMPAPAAHGLPFAITLCSSVGPVPGQVHLADADHDSGHDHSQLFENCPFGLSFAHKFMSGPYTSIRDTELVHFLLPALRGSLLPDGKPLLGPPLGSRAPPASNLRSDQENPNI